MQFNTDYYWCSCIPSGVNNNVYVDFYVAKSKLVIDEHKCTQKRDKQSTVQFRVISNGFYIVAYLNKDEQERVTCSFGIGFVTTPMMMPNDGFLSDLVAYHSMLRSRSNLHEKLSWKRLFVLEKMMHS